MMNDMPLYYTAVAVGDELDFTALLAGEFFMTRKRVSLCVAGGTGAQGFAVLPAGDPGRRNRAIDAETRWPHCRRRRAVRRNIG